MIFVLTASILANFSTVEMVSLSESLTGCPRLYDVVPESSRHYLENMQSMIKSKAELESMEPPPDAYWDPVLKRNRAKQLKLFVRLRALRSTSSASSSSTRRRRGRNA